MEDGNQAVGKASSGQEARPGREEVGRGDRTAGQREEREGRPRGGRRLGTDEKLEVKVGDQIIISDSFSNTEVIEGESKYLLVKDSEILAIVE